MKSCVFQRKADFSQVMCSNSSKYPLIANIGTNPALSTSAIFPTLWSDESNQTNKLYSEIPQADCEKHPHELTSLADQIGCPILNIQQLKLATVDQCGRHAGQLIPREIQIFQTFQLANTIWQTGEFVVAQNQVN
ncbi:conserved hypothetical protein [Trichinella spiralis]|uniref:hypothetical protein n=1 Tax=Trichinella spiralis TaxID=6334 RepID=UPI0001EFBC7A|nr:conserved hypothetical protein [Trichinella spiralis]